MFEVILPDGKKVESEISENWLSFIKRVIGEGLAKAAVAVSINDKLVDVTAEVESGNMSVITMKMPEGVAIMRHSASHIMADAVQKLFPGTKVTIGPSIENGFYYDFDSEHRFSVDDFEAIEKKMSEIVKEKQPFIRKVVTKEEAIELFTKMGENYKVEIIEDLGEPFVSLYYHGDFVDLCRGPHVPNTGFVKVYPPPPQSPRP